MNLPKYYWHYLDELGTENFAKVFDNFPPL